MSDNDPKPPTPDEITHKLAEFMKTNFGDAVKFSAFPGAPVAEDEGEPEEPEIVEDEERGDVFSFSYRPRDIKAHLDRFVIRQDEGDDVGSRSHVSLEADRQADGGLGPPGLELDRVQAFESQLEKLLVQRGEGLVEERRDRSRQAVLRAVEFPGCRVLRRRQPDQPTRQSQPGG